MSLTAAEKQHNYEKHKQAERKRKQVQRANLTKNLENSTENNK